MLVEYINDEILLELCLLDQETRNFDLEGNSGELLTLYAMQQFPDPENASCAEVTEKIKEIMTSFTLRRLVEKGELEVCFDENGEASYKKVEHV